jgi:hypothetical protein
MIRMTGEVLQADSELVWVQTSDALPARGDWVLYWTDLYQSAGYIDSDGHWRDSRDRIERRDVLRWTPFQAPDQESLLTPDRNRLSQGKVEPRGCLLNPGPDVPTECFRARP